MGMTDIRGDAGPTQRGAIPADTFAARLVLVRVHKGMTIDEAATATGLNRQSWSNWEKGMVPRDQLDVVQIISEKLDIDREWLLWGGALTKPQIGASRRAMARRLRPTEEYGGSVKRTRSRGMRTPLTSLVSHPVVRPSVTETVLHASSGNSDGTCSSPSLTRPAILIRRPSA